MNDSLKNYMQGALLRTWGYTDEFREFKSVLVFSSYNTLVEAGVGGLASLHCILHTMPSLVHFET